MTTLNEFETGDKSFQLTNVAQLQRWLPWLRMFRSFRIAIDYQKIIVSLEAVVIWGLGSYLLSLMLVHDVDVPAELRSGVPAVSALSSPASNRWYERYAGRSSWREFDAGDPLASTIRMTNTITWPYERITRSYLGLAQLGNYRWWWHSWLQLLWGLAVAALFGGTVARMAAREFTGHGRSLFRDAKFSCKQAPVVYLAPFISLISFAFLWSLNWLAGFAGRIPVVGEIALAVCWGAFLLCGLLLSLLLLGMMLGWPLMLCSGSVEKNDAFDALSRAFSYLLNRPWYAMFLTGIAFVYGSLTMIFVVFATCLTVSMSLASVGAGLGKDIKIVAFTNLLELQQISQSYFENSFASGIFEFWIGVALLVPAAYAFSFFWTSTTIAYFLLRRREDGTPLHEIDLSDSNAGGRPELAVVGIPAAELRENS